MLSGKEKRGGRSEKKKGVGGKGSKGDNRAGLFEEKAKGGRDEMFGYEMIQQGHKCSKWGLGPFVSILGFFMTCVRGKRKEHPVFFFFFLTCIGTFPKSDWNF